MGSPHGDFSPKDCDDYLARRITRACRPLTEAEAAEAPNRAPSPKVVQAPRTRRPGGQGRERDRRPAEHGRPAGRGTARQPESGPALRASGNPGGRRTARPRPRSRRPDSGNHAEAMTRGLSRGRVGATWLSRGRRTPWTRGRRSGTRLTACRPPLPRPADRCEPRIPSPVSMPPSATEAESDGT